MATKEPQKTSTAYLLGQAGAVKDQKILLTKQLIIGRDEHSCDIALASVFISKHQAALETDQSGRTTVRDLGSKFGTFVNGKSVLEQVLINGDLIGFGPNGVIRFKFCLDPDEVFTSDSASRLSTLEGASVASRQVIRLGRAPDNDVVLNAPGVSRYHASLSYGEHGQATLLDLDSTNGTYVNGEVLREPRAIGANDLIFICGFLVRVDGLNIKPIDLSCSRILANGIFQKIDGKTLLNDITLALLPREFVGLMGPSGCGKSTLMNALCGLRPATSGSVFLSTFDLYHNFNALRRSIGYVPQEDLLHEVLTVERTLYYAAKLRLPEKTPPLIIRRVIDEVIQTLGLAKQRLTQFRQLSGGQKKRLSLGIELTTKPSFLFLDEPTSPLDPESTENMMILFRQLADQGRLVVMVTHKFDKFFQMHHVALLAQNGRLAFFGPPSEALEYFQCTEPTDIYRRISAMPPAELDRRFRSSAQYKRHVSQRVAESRALMDEPITPSVLATKQVSRRRFSLSQWWLLTRRCFEIKLKDRRNTALLLLQAPAIAFILVLISGREPNDAKTLFICSIIAIWFGANNAMRDIVAESPIYVRERRYSVKIPSYVLSKFAVLGLIGLIQSVLFLAILISFKLLDGRDFLFLFGILYLTILGGISTALFCSAVVTSTEKAMTLLPLILIPQLLLSGFLKPTHDLYVNLRTGTATTVEQYRQFADAERASRQTRLRPPHSPLREPLLDPVAKYTGLGIARPLSAAVMARWSIDGLVHAVSLHNSKTRDQLAAQVYVHSYYLVLQGYDASDVEDSYQDRVWIDLAILGGFSCLFLILTMWALKKKDVL